MIVAEMQPCKTRVVTVVESIASGTLAMSSHCCCCHCGSTRWPPTLVVDICSFDDFGYHSSSRCLHQWSCCQAISSSPAVVGYWLVLALTAFVVCGSSSTGCQFMSSVWLWRHCLFRKRISWSGPQVPDADNLPSVVSKQLAVALTVVVGELDGDVNEIASILLAASFISFDVAGHMILEYNAEEIIKG